MSAVLTSVHLVWFHAVHDRTPVMQRRASPGTRDRHRGPLALFALTVSTASTGGTGTP
jgi:hypothetical protein